MPKDPSQKMMQVVEVLQVISKERVKKNPLQLIKKKMKKKKGKKKEMDKEQNRKVMGNLLKHHVHMIKQLMMLRKRLMQLTLRLMLKRLLELKMVRMGVMMMILRKI